jgi:cyclophilin family peptidyl-prolyl cis-trans isomerase
MKKIIVLFTLSLLICVTSNAQKDSKKSSSSNRKEKQPVSTEKMVLISTSLGDMKVKLYDATPKHRDNFLKLVEQSYYDSLLFHRVIRNFMIQGGDPLSKNAAPGVPLGNGDIGYTIPAEFVDSIFHKKGALCAARTENPEKASSGCQFYIVQGQVLTPEQLNSLEMQRGLKLSEAQKKLYSTIGGSPWLDGAYTVYGEVVEGLDIIDKIATVQTSPQAGDRPVQNVYILKMTLLNK